MGKSYTNYLYNSNIRTSGRTSKVVTSKQAKLEQSLDGFKMTVSDTYATIDGLNEVKESIQNKDGYTIILSKECIVTTCE